MIHALRLANFKAFGASQRIPLRPITLVFGANTAGKSSLIHALALAHHAVGTGELDTQRSEIGGEAIDLGGFRQYVHRRERGRQVELGFELDPGRLSGRVAEFLRPARAVLVELAIGAGFSSEQRTLFGEIGRQLDRAGGVRLERFALVVDGAPLLSMTARPGGLLRLDRLDHHHTVFREVFRGIVTLATTTQDLREEDFEGLGEVLDALIPGITARPRGLFPRVEEEAEAPGVEASPAFLTVSRGRRREDLARAARMFLPGALRDLVGGVASTVFVDPHFGPEKLRHRRTLQAFLQAVIQGRPVDGPRRLEVHTSMDDTGTREFFEGKCRGRLPRCIPGGVNLRIVRLQPRLQGKRLHNRYILTDLGGVLFGVGLDEGDGGATDDLHLLDRAQYDERWQQYASDAPAFA